MHTCRYLRMRYALAPSIISAGRTNQLHGLPLAARCDLFWPNHTAARRNDQYISTFADALVAPRGETTTSRSVYLPPGEWCVAMTQKHYPTFQNPH